MSSTFVRYPLDRDQPVREVTWVAVGEWELATSASVLHGPGLSRLCGRNGKLGKPAARDQRGYVVVVTGVLYGTTRRSLYPVREFLFATDFAFQLRRASPAAVTPAPSLAAFPLRAAPAPRTPFTIYTTDTAARCTVQPTPRYSFIPLPQLSLS